MARREHRVQFNPRTDLDPVQGWSKRETILLERRVNTIKKNLKLYLL